MLRGAAPLLQAAPALWRCRCLTRLTPVATGQQIARAPLPLLRPVCSRHRDERSARLTGLQTARCAAAQGLGGARRSPGQDPDDSVRSPRREAAAEVPSLSLRQSRRLSGAGSGSPRRGLGGRGPVPVPGPAGPEPASRQARAAVTRATASGDRRRGGVTCPEAPGGEEVTERRGAPEAKI